MREPNFTARAELRLVARAIREGWPTPPAQQAREIRQLGVILENPGTSHRLALAAIRILILADRDALGLPVSRAKPRRRGPRRRRGRARTDGETPAST